MASIFLQNGVLAGKINVGPAEESEEKKSSARRKSRRKDSGMQAKQE